MNQSLRHSPLDGRHVHLVGAKGTGMAALAEILASRGCILSGSDVADVFYTDAILASLGIKAKTGFDPAHIPVGTDLVVHSAAYSRDTNIELLAAVEAGIQVLNYPEALGLISSTMDSTAIAGVHGKTTTTAMAGSVVAALGLEATVLAGSAVSSFGDHSTLIRGTSFFIAETCEYRRHFLNFHPARMIVTSIEPDHQDYYPGYRDILAAFVDFGSLLPHRGLFVYCADDPGASEAAAAVKLRRPDIIELPYGYSAEGRWRLTEYTVEDGLASFGLAGLPGKFELGVPGRHLSLDAAAAILIGLFLEAEASGEDPLGILWNPPEGSVEAARRAIAAFRGSKRRSEILGLAGGILFMDDYGHHPTAIRETLRGIRSFWPERRLIVDFMSHTQSRTRSLFEDFSRCLDAADVVVLHKIYPSAREIADERLNGYSLYKAVLSGRSNVTYFEEPMDALDYLSGFLREGDLFITMGAGDNWKLGEALFRMHTEIERNTPSGETGTGPETGNSADPSTLHPPRGMQ